MPSYVYLKVEEKRGGNNVAYLLMWRLKQCGLASNFKPNPERACKGIDIFINNWAGKNNNKIVIHILIFLVGRKICK